MSFLLAIQTSPSRPLLVRPITLPAYVFFFFFPRSTSVFPDLTYKLVSCLVYCRCPIEGGS
jgi:hypothetical protein